MGRPNEFPLHDNGGRAPTTSSLVIAGRLLLLLLAAVATASGFALSRGNDHAATGSGESYVCPMHAEVTSAAPGDCPICRMALKRVGTATGSPDHKVTDTAKRRAFALEVRAPAWLETDDQVAAVLYGHDLAGLSPGEHGSFFPATAPAVGIDVTVLPGPPAPWDGATSKVQFRLARPAPQLGPGTVGWVKLAAKSRELLVIPATAVLYSTEGSYVLAARPDGRTFEKRRVEIGRLFRGLAAVLSGLREGEAIVVASTFLFDVERRLQAQREQAAAVIP